MWTGKCTDNDFTEPEKTSIPVFLAAIRSTVYRLAYYHNDVSWSFFCKQARRLIGSIKKIRFKYYLDLYK